MAISLDGSVATGSNTGAAGTASATITTPSTNDILVLFYFNNSADHPTNISSITDSNSLTWTKHASANVTLTGATNNLTVLEIWWAFAAAAQASNTVVVHAGQVTADPDDQGVIIQGFNGCNTSTPFDANASIPGTNSATSNTAPTVGSMTTTSASPLLLLFAMSADAGGDPADQTTVTFGGVGGTILSSKDSSGGSDFSRGAVGYKAASASSTSFTFGASWNRWQAIATALQAAGGDTFANMQQLLVM